MRNFDPTLDHPKLYADACRRARLVAPDVPDEVLAIMFRAGYRDGVRSARKRDSQIKMESL